MIGDDSEPAPYMPVVPPVVPTGPRVTPVSMPVNMPGVPTGLQPRGFAKPDFLVELDVAPPPPAVAGAAEATMPRVGGAGGQSPGREDVPAPAVAPPVRSWAAASRLDVATIPSTSTAANEIFRIASCLPLTAVARADWVYRKR